MAKDSKAQPLLKWPGGKRRVLPEIRKYVPPRYNSYYEPFFGGGAVYFDIAPDNAVIADINPDIINLYTQVKNSPKDLIQELQKTKYANTLNDYNAIRALDRNEKLFSLLNPIEKAARIIYLNRTCFNGLYRVNTKNQFNAAFGKYDDPRIIDEENIFSVSKIFNKSNATILHESYDTVLDSVQGTENFIYLDPPYIPLSLTSSFTRYSKDRFPLAQQEDLRDRAKSSDDKGNYVLLSNSDTPLTRELYQDFKIMPIQVKRSVGASASTRIHVGEVLIIGKTLALNLGI